MPPLFSFCTEMKYILNHYYTLRHDKKRSYIISPSDNSYEKPIPVNAGWVSRIHPAYAMMLSFFAVPVELEDAYKSIAKFFSAPYSTISSFFEKLLTEKEPTYTTLCGHENGFPINLIILEKEEFAIRHHYKPEDFVFEELDLNTSRFLQAPLSIVFMPNNTCRTNCIYCYADRKTKPSFLPFGIIERMIREARELNIRDVLITGGDFFMYEKWEDLLKLLIHENYKPDLISTKVPINKATIASFSKFNIRLQISLDSNTSSIASKVLGVSRAYTAKMRNSIYDIDKTNIRYQIATVLTSFNDSLIELEKLAFFIKTLSHIERWEIRIAFSSLYTNTDFEEIKSRREQIEHVAIWIEQNRKNFPFEILWSPDEDHSYMTTKGGSRFFEGAACSANLTNMVVLPDGAVTICEQLYWNQHFIIGNINSNSISEIWNSQKALSLWRQRQEDIKEESPCRHCLDFNDCFNASNRCYANIMKAYGMANYDYPDPRCYLAPIFKNTITHD